MYSPNTVCLALVTASKVAKKQKNPFFSMTNCHLPVVLVWQPLDSTPGQLWLINFGWNITGSQWIWNESATDRLFPSFSSNFLTTFSSGCSEGVSRSVSMSLVPIFAAGLFCEIWPDIVPTRLPRRWATLLHHIVGKKSSQRCDHILHFRPCLVRLRLDWKHFGLANWTPIFCAIWYWIPFLLQAQTNDHGGNNRCKSSNHVYCWETTQIWRNII